jgi:hypothetical protein
MELNPEYIELAALRIGKETPETAPARRRQAA